MSKRKNQSDGASDGPFDQRSQINSPILAQKFDITTIEAIHRYTTIAYFITLHVTYRRKVT